MTIIAFGGEESHMFLLHFDLNVNELQLLRLTGGAKVSGQNVCPFFIYLKVF